MTEDEQEDKDKPYESFEDWKKDVAHLKWPTIIMGILLLILLIYLSYFYE